MGQPQLMLDEQNTLVVDNLVVVGYLVSEALRRVPSHVQRDDLAAAGMLALVKAARAFDPSLGVPFARYASTRIRGAIVDELRSMDWTPRGARQRVRQLSETTDRLTSLLGRAPDDAEIAGALGVPVAEVRSARTDAGRQLLSLDVDTAGAASSARTVGREAGSVPDGAPGPEQALLVRERLRYLDAAVAQLPDRLREVVVELFRNETPVAELAVRLGVTQSRISQLKSQALALVRDAMTAALEPDLSPAPVLEPGVAERRRQAYVDAVVERGRTGPQPARVPVSPSSGSTAAVAALARSLVAGTPGPAVAPMPVA